jgi:group I intron endonuclease
MDIVTDKKQLRLAGIYGIINSAGFCKYVGQTYCFSKRWTEHKRLLRKGKHGNTHLQHAWNKYGERHFRFTVLEFCQLEYLNEREQFWIDELKPEYNIITNLLEWQYIKKFPKEEIYVKKGESFPRPKWHLWVYGGHKRPTT